MPVLEIGAARLDYVERGEGDAVVLVHGSSSDRRTWDVQLRPLAKAFRVVAYSRRYHFPNAPIGEGADYCMQEHVEDLAAFVDGLDLAPVHVVGHSYGGFVALLFALQRADQVRSLVLEEPPVLTLFTSSTPRPRELLRLALARPRTAIAIAKLGATGFGPATAALRHGDEDRAFRCVGTAVLGPAVFARLSPERREQARINFIAQELLGSGFPRLDADALRELAIPVLLVEGERSPRVFHRFHDRLVELLPHVQRRTIPVASHIAHEDNAPAFAEAVLAFLRAS